jgi:hypothetical protein
MKHDVLLKKLRIKPDMNYAVLNKPPEFSGFPGADDKIRKGADLNALLLFIGSKGLLEKQLPKILPAVSPGTVFWISYPKQDSGIACDLNRDSLWKLMQKYDYSAVSQVSLHLKWSALWFKPRDKVISRKFVTPLVDMAGRTVKVPKDLKSAFMKNKKAEEFFNSLSFTHKKEYVIWIESAKKEETRKSRILKTTDMLNRGMKER